MLYCPAHAERIWPRMPTQHAFRHVRAPVVRLHHNSPLLSTATRSVSVAVDIVHYKHATHTHTNIYDARTGQARTPESASGRYRSQKELEQVYLLTSMDRATLLHAKSTISLCSLSAITKKRASVDSKLLRRPRNVGYYPLFER